MNKYKLIVFDLDGTLLNNKMKISFYTKVKLNQIIKKGIKCAIISSRTLKDIKRLTKKIRFSYICALNGALIFNNFSNSMENESYINTKIINEILKNEDIKKYPKDFYANDKVLISGFAENKFAKIYQKNLKPVVIQDDFICEKIFGADLIAGSTGEAEKISALLRKKYKNLISVKNAGYNFVTINNKNVCKGKALSFISKKMKIKLNETIVIGDSETDIDMFHKNCLKIAMKESNKKLIKYADKVTIFNNNKNGAIKAVLKELEI